MSTKPVALVTGGSRGIGLGIAEALARNGFDLAINGRRPESDVRPTLTQLEALGASACYCAADIASAEDRAAMLDRIKQTFGRLDVLVNNAGVAPKVRADVLEADEDSFDFVLGVNLKGPYFLTQAAARLMIEPRESSGYRAVINIGSISATVASVNRGDYCLSKAGIGMATKLWAVRLADFGIDVFEVRPGITATDMTAGVKEKYDALIEGGLTLQKRWGTPEDIGKVVAAMATGQVPYATGTVIYVDGGMTIDRL